MLSRMYVADKELSQDDLKEQIERAKSKGTITVNAFYMKKSEYITNDTGVAPESDKGSVPEKAIKGKSVDCQVV